MSRDLLTRFHQLRSAADEFQAKALWEEKLRVLQEIRDLCESEQLPDWQRHRQDVLYDLGALRRRFGQYDLAEKTLDEAAAAASSNPLKTATILGELCVVLRHQNRFEEALRACLQQYNLANAATRSIDADAEMCRAIGNAGMCAYNLSAAKDAAESKKLLTQAEVNLQERIERAVDMQKIVSKWTALAKTWETIGLDRLSLVLIAQGRVEEAVAVTERSQAQQTRIDPTVSAYSRFFHGNALWHNGRNAEALEQWNAPTGVCSCPMVFCKEPADEHNQYLQLMADAGVNFDSYDEQGYNALDYAVLSQSRPGKEAARIVIAAIRQWLTAADGEVPQTQVIDYHIDSRLRQAEVRRLYRILLQETFRPRLRTSDKKRDTIRELRKAFQSFVSSAEQHLARFRCMKYRDFKAHGKLPRSSEGLAAEIDDDAFVIFFSYRWRGHGLPDDVANTQWCRMINAVEHCIAKMQLKVDEIAVWLDFACIDQDEPRAKLRGIDSLPLAVTLSNAMISLVDDLYYTRAWCGVEVMLIDALVDSYGLHHRLEFDDVLKDVAESRALSSSRLELTNEIEDRPMVEFLARQSKLIGAVFA